MCMEREGQTNSDACDVIRLYTIFYHSLLPEIRIRKTIEEGLIRKRKDVHINRYSPTRLHTNSEKHLLDTIVNELINRQSNIPTVTYIL